MSDGCVTIHVNGGAMGPIGPTGPQGPSGPVGATGLAGPPAALSVTLTLTRAQLLAIHDAPVQIIPAPGAGFVIDISEMIGSYTFGTTPYTGGNFFGAHVGSFPAYLGADFPIFMTEGNSAFATVSGNTSSPAPATSVVANQPAYMQAASNFAGGDGTVKITLKYNIVPV